MSKTNNKKSLKHIDKFGIVLIAFSTILLGCSEKRKNLNILFAGDIMLDRGTRDIIEVHGLDYLFENVHRVIKSSDVAIANFECVACDSTLKPINKKFTFRANTDWLTSLDKNGITHVTIANNHSFDFGVEGVKQTIKNLNRNGIKPIGYNENNNSIGLPTIISKNRNAIAVFSSCFLKQNNKYICTENASELAEKIKKFKGIHPTYLIIVCIHWGVEMELKPTLEQVEKAHLLIESGADIIIGHHPHVVQTIEIYKGKYIFYSLGNFIFDNHHTPANRGILTNISISKGRIKSIQIIPFSIVKSKPQIMNIEESENYRKEIERVSIPLNLKQTDGIWKIL